MKAQPIDSCGDNEIAFYHIRAVKIYAYPLHVSKPFDFVTAVEKPVHKSSFMHLDPVHTLDKQLPSAVALNKMAAQPAYIIDNFSNSDEFGWCRRTEFPSSLGLCQELVMAKLGAEELVWRKVRTVYL